MTKSHYDCRELCLLNVIRIYSEYKPQAVESDHGVSFYVKQQQIGLNLPYKIHNVSQKENSSHEN